MCDSPIELRESVKDLGVIIDKHLSWTQHVCNVSRKVFSALNSLRRFWNVFSCVLKERLVSSLILPHFDYCDVVYKDLTVTLKNKLQHAQNACVRYIFNLRYYDHVTPAYEQLNWLRLNQRRDLHSLCILQQILSTSTPAYLHSQLHRLSYEYTLGTRSKNDTLLLIPIHRTVRYTNSFVVATARLWNNLPRSVRGANPSSIKQRCQQYILTK